MRLRLTGGAEKNEKSNDSNGNRDEQHSQEQMADRTREYHRAVLPGAEIFDGLLSEQRLDWRCWARFRSHYTRLITQNNLLFKNDLNFK
ncbi:hypothetical protein [Janthinobacterium sp. TND4EL3]|uniref:hypothetical protein n=1 Tax=Janthinobacterium sp. TND4EL3 TaxID=1907311 RepID=UPI001FCD7D6E|nr:hypothetical protein [Janthinobacterium sp. TND4EL3]